MAKGKNLLDRFLEMGKDENFLHAVEKVENLVAKVLSIALIIIIFVSIVDLILFLSKELIKEPVGFFNITLIEIFGLFLNILIALELLENLTGYLKKHIIHVELVIVTSLIAVARKIIIFDFKKYDSGDLMSLGISILALSVSYWLIKKVSIDKEH